VTARDRELPQQIEEYLALSEALVNVVQAQNRLIHGQSKLIEGLRLELHELKTPRIIDAKQPKA
jgi:hypothetical protein